MQHGRKRTGMRHDRVDIVCDALKWIVRQRRKSTVLVYSFTSFQHITSFGVAALLLDSSLWSSALHPEVR